MRPNWLPFPLYCKAYSSVTPAGIFISRFSNTEAVLDPWQELHGFKLIFPDPEHDVHGLKKIKPLRVLDS